MAITKTEVFIASNFDEFKELRSHIRNLIDSYRGFPMQAVDLNDNRASAHPPLKKSIQAVRHSEVMILLIGEQYGGIPPGKGLSYSHLEYRTALDSDYKIVILPYCIGKSYKNTHRKFTGDSKLISWVKEVMENHTISRFSPNETDVATIAFNISQEVQKVIYDSFSESEQTQVDAEDQSDEDLGALDLSMLPADELKFLERRSGIAETSLNVEEAFKDEMDVISNPTKAASLEQGREAVRAMEIGERLVAMQHLRRALKYRPLDIEANYWLARLLVETGRRKECREAIQLSLRSVKLATHDKRDVRVAAAYVLAAQGASKTGNFKVGLNYAKQACQTAPWLALTHIELACQYIKNGLLNEAFRTAEKAFYRHPFSILKLNREPSFQRFPHKFKNFKKGLRKKLGSWVKELLESESKTNYMLNDLVSENKRKTELNHLSSKLDFMSLMDLIRIGRDSGKQHLKYLQKCLTEIKIQKQKINLIYLSIEHAKNRDAPKLEEKIAKYLLAGGVLLGMYLGSLLTFIFLLGLCGIAIDVSKFLGKRKRYRLHIVNLTEKCDIEKNKYRDAIAAFQHSAVNFERAAVQQIIFSPSMSLKSSKLHSLIRIDAKIPELSEKFIFDHHILPPELRKDVMTPIENQSQYKLYRIIHEFDKQIIAARWSCYDNTQDIDLQLDNKQAPSLNLIIKNHPVAHLKVVSMKFYENGYNQLPEEQRIYKRRFVKSETRYVYWEVRFVHPPQKRRIDYTINSTYYRPDGKVFAQNKNIKISILEDWIYSWQTRGWGWKDYGNWVAGLYKVALYSEGVKIVDNTFEIYNG